MTTILVLVFRPFITLATLGLLGWLGWRVYRARQTRATGGRMSLFTKLSDVLRANVNDLLDKAVDPLKQLDLMLEDMRSFRREQAASVGKAIAAQRQVEADSESARSEVKRWEDAAAGNAAAGRDEQAKSCIKHQLRYEEMARTTEAASKQAAANVLQLRDDLKVLDEKIEDLTSKRSVYEVRARTAQATAGIHRAVSSAPGAPNTSEVTERVEQSLRRQESEAVAASEVEKLSESYASDHEHTSDEVEARLAALKGQQAAKAS